LDNWARNRWTWKRAARRDPRLSDCAKVLAAALCDDFAHHETAYCAPRIATLAEALAKSDRSVQRALSELRQAGWIAIRSGGGRGVSSEITFEKGDGTVAFSDQERVTHMAQAASQTVTDVSPKEAKRVTLVAEKGDSSVVPPCTPYKDKPNLNQRARATTERPAPQCRACIHPGTHNHTAWNAWYAGRGYPSLEKLGIPSSDKDGTGWDAPFPLPPRPDDLIGTRIAEKHAEWASCRMMERRSA